MIYVSATEYKILTGLLPEELEQKVNKLLKDGWSLLGGPVNHSGWMCQPMVKLEPSIPFNAR